MMPFEGIQVQLVDLPAVAPAATPSWLRGLVSQALVPGLRFANAVGAITTTRFGAIPALPTRASRLFWQRMPTDAINAEVER